MKPSPDRRSPNDHSLAAYLRTIRRIPVLTQAEEQTLARRAQTGDGKAMHELVRCNLRYVVAVANRYRGCGLGLLDIINEGNLGLMEAARRFDPGRGFKFITYAVWWIRQAIMHALAQYSGTVRLPMKQAGVLAKLGIKVKECQQQQEKEPSLDDLAQAMGIKSEELAALLRVSHTHLSLDTPIKENGETSYLDLLEAVDTPSVEELLVKSSLAREMDGLLKDLSPREEQVLRLRFGFEGDPLTLEEIGKLLCLSRERVRQIEKKAKRRLLGKARTKTLQDYLN